MWATRPQFCCGIGHVLRILSTNIYNTERYCHFHLLSVSYNFMYLWRLILNIIKTYITSFFHRQSNLSLSLSLSHTHTHIFQVAKCGRKLSASLAFGHCSYITQSNAFCKKEKKMFLLSLVWQCITSHNREFFSVQEVQWNTPFMKKWIIIMQIQ